MTFSFRSMLNAPFALVLCASSFAAAQKPAPKQTGKAQPEKSEPVSSPAPVDMSGNPEGAPTPEDLIARRAVPYRPTLSRDPFSAPNDAETVNRGDMVDDIAVKGILKKGGKYFAVVSDSRGNVRWLPVGYKFRDGEIAAVDDKAVTFHQWDPNSTVKSQYKTITKTFKREEGKR